MNNDIKIRHYISPNGDFEFQHSVADPPENVPRETHHDQYEIHMYLRGHITFFAEGYSYKGTRGDTIIINGHELHKVKIESQIPYERIVIHFKESYISDIENFGTSSLLSFINKKKCGDHVIPARKGGGPLDFDFVQQIEDFIDSDLPERDIMIRVLFIGYLFNLKRIREKTIINRKKNKDHDERIQRITSYIDKNPSKKMTLDFFSEEYYINKYYLCHLFKKETGFTIIEYINNKRIILAKKLMLENKSIIDSCYAAGFTDYPNFYKIFKRTTGVSPREYIRSNKN